MAAASYRADPNPFDYATDILLIAVVARQVRSRQLTLRSLLLPLGLDDASLSHRPTRKVRCLDPE